MKKFVILLFLIASGCITSAMADDLTGSVGTGKHEHDGFYYSIGLGTHFGNMTHKIDSGPYKIDFDYQGGSGLTLDFKIGWAVSENIVAHLGSIVEATYEPKIKSSNDSIVDYDYTFGTGAIMYGIGGTYYVMPYNAFVSATIGFSTFGTVQQVAPTPEEVEAGEEIQTELAKTDPGFAFQLKLGKEWWISRNWGIGLALTYTNMSVDYKRTGMLDKANEKMNSGKFGILLNATFN